MPIYTATFFTAADCASRLIEAANAQQALETGSESLRRATFPSSSDGIEPLEQIEICLTPSQCRQVGTALAVLPRR